MISAVSELISVSVLSLLSSLDSFNSSLCLLISFALKKEQHTQCIYLFEKVCCLYLFPSYLERIPDELDLLGFSIAFIF